MLFNNHNIHPQWKEAWKAKEKALKTRYVKTLENLTEHSRPLPPLRHGDHVMIQSQHGRFPKKWDKSGIVVETKENDQYTIKVAGTGRLTLRNRRFLRKYDPHYPQGPAWKFAHPGHTDNISDTPINRIHRNISPHSPHATASEQSTSPNTTDVPLRKLPTITDDPDLQTPTQSLTVHSPQRFSFGNFVIPDPAFTNYVAPPTVAPPNATLPTIKPSAVVPTTEVQHTTRPVRKRKQRQLYDASSGRYLAPSGVPEYI